MVFVSPEDLANLGLVDGQPVDLISEWHDGAERRATEFRIVAYPTARGCARVLPETNVLVPLDSTADMSNTPTSKSVIVRLEPTGEPGEIRLAMRPTVGCARDWDGGRYEYNQSRPGLDVDGLRRGRAAAAAFCDRSRSSVEANHLELAGWEDGIPDMLTAPDGRIVWNRANDAG